MSRLRRLRYALACLTHYHVTGDRAARAAGARAACAATCCRRRWRFWSTLDHAALRQASKGNQ